MRNSENAHAYRCSPCRARAAAGIAVATEIDSNAIAVTVMHRATTVSARRRRADTSPRRADVETPMPVAKHPAGDRRSPESLAARRGEDGAGGPLPPPPD